MARLVSPTSKEQVPESGASWTLVPFRVASCHQSQWKALSQPPVTALSWAGRIQELKSRPVMQGLRVRQEPGSRALALCAACLPMRGPCLASWKQRVQDGPQRLLRGDTGGGHYRMQQSHHRARGLGGGRRSTDGDQEPDRVGRRPEVLLGEGCRGVGNALLGCSLAGGLPALGSGRSPWQGSGRQMWRTGILWESGWDIPHALYFSLVLHSKQEVQQVSPFPRLPGC